MWDRTRLWYIVLAATIYRLGTRLWYIVLAATIYPLGTRLWYIVLAATIYRLGTRLWYIVLAATIYRMINYELTCSIPFYCVQPLINHGSHNFLRYLQRIQWIIIQPPKSLATLLFQLLPVVIISKKMSLKIVCETRHYPSILDSYLGFITKYGLVLPINDRLLEKMPFVATLMSLNTFSAHNMEYFLDKHYNEKSTPQSKRIFNFDKIMFWENKGTKPQEHQTSNVPMAIAILVKLLKASYYEPGHPLHMNLVRFNYSWYGKFFAKGGKHGLSQATPIDLKIHPNFHLRYREMVNLAFDSTNGMKAELNSDNADNYYSLEEVLMALLYDVTPNYHGVQKVRPTFKFTLEECDQINKYLEEKFMLNEDYYGLMMQKGLPVNFSLPKPKSPKEPKPAKEGARKKRKSKKKVTEDKELEVTPIRTRSARQREEQDAEGETNVDDTVTDLGQVVESLEADEDNPQVQEEPATKLSKYERQLARYHKTKSEHRLRFPDSKVQVVHPHNSFAVDLSDEITRVFSYGFELSCLWNSYVRSYGEFHDKHDPLDFYYACSKRTLNDLEFQHTEEWDERTHSTVYAPVQNVIDLVNRTTMVFVKDAKIPPVPNRPVEDIAMGTELIYKAATVENNVEAYSQICKKVIADIGREDQDFVYQLPPSDPEKYHQWLLLQPPLTSAAHIEPPVNEEQEELPSSPVVPKTVWMLEKDYDNDAESVQENQSSEKGEDEDLKPSAVETLPKEVSAVAEDSPMVQTEEPPVIQEVSTDIPAGAEDSPKVQEHGPETPVQTKELQSRLRSQSKKRKTSGVDPDTVEQVEKKKKKPRKALAEEPEESDSSKSTTISEMQAKASKQKKLIQPRKQKEKKTATPKTKGLAKEPEDSDSSESQTLTELHAKASKPRKLIKPRKQKEKKTATPPTKRDISGEYKHPRSNKK